MNFCSDLLVLMTSQEMCDLEAETNMLMLGHKLKSNHTFNHGAALSTQWSADPEHTEIPLVCFCLSASHYANLTIGGSTSHH